MSLDLLAVLAFYFFVIYLIFDYLKEIEIKELIK
jgi:hypothetical protein